MRAVVATVAALVLLCATLLVWRFAPRRLTVTSGQFPEELVYVRSSDDVVNGGVMFRSASKGAKPIAVIADHMYTGEETQVAQLIATWADGVLAGKTD